jgi:hypothetical protein
VSTQVLKSTCRFGEGSSSSAKLITTPRGSEPSKYRSPHSASLGGAGRETFFNKVPVEGIYAVHAENQPIPRIAGAAGRLGQADDALPGAHRCKRSIGSAVPDLEPQLCIESPRFSHVAHRQSHRTDLIDPPRGHGDAQVRIYRASRFACCLCPRAWICP